MKQTTVCDGLPEMKPHLLDGHIYCTVTYADWSFHTVL